MEKATWEEIKSLASDFKHAQATSTNLKLSERNCIDIINYLCNNKLLQLHFTTDGKTFLTTEELKKEIYEELDYNNGRIDFSSLSNSLDIDLYTIENIINIMIQNDCELQIVMNSLINSAYIRQISLKINEILKNKGKSTFGELTQIFDLPKMFIEKLISNNIGFIIDAHKEGDIIYTNNFIRRYTASIRGYLSRSSKSIAMSILINKFSIPEKLIIKIITELINNRRLLGKLENNKSIFTPEIYLKNQRVYLGEFYRQNNYVEFSRMKDVGIQNPVKFVEINDFPNSLILTNCIIDKSILEQFEAVIDECDRLGGFINCFETVPTVLNRDDLAILVGKVINRFSRLRLIGGEFIISESFIDRCLSYFDDILKIKAEEYVNRRKKHRGEKIVKDDDLDSSKNEIDNKSIKIKFGGGQRGREIKSKTVKNKYFGDKKQTDKTKNRDDDDEEKIISLDFITEEEAIDLLSIQLAEESPPVELLKSLFFLIEKPLDLRFKKECKSVILQTSDTAKMKADHVKLEVAVSSMINKIKLVEKGLFEISCISLRNDLIKYCLRSLCNDLTNCLLEFIAKDNDLEFDTAQFTNETKNKLIGQLKVDLANKIKAINKSLKDDQSLEGFYVAFENLCAVLDIFPKKLDKKTEKRFNQEIGAQLHSILEKKLENGEEIDPGELLLLTTMLLFQKIVGYPLQASGKFVPELLIYLQQNFPNYAETVDWLLLKSYQNYIIAYMKMGTSEEEGKASFKSENRDLHEKVLQLALNWKSIKEI